MVTSSKLYFFIVRQKKRKKTGFTWDDLFKGKITFFYQTWEQKYTSVRPVIINMLDEKFTNNSKSSKNVMKFNAHLDDTKSQFSTFSNERNIMIIIT